MVILEKNGLWLSVGLLIAGKYLLKLGSLNAFVMCLEIYRKHFPFYGRRQEQAGDGENAEIHLYNQHISVFFSIRTKHQPSMETTSERINLPLEGRVILLACILLWHLVHLIIYPFCPYDPRSAHLETCSIHNLS